MQQQHWCFVTFKLLFLFATINASTTKSLKSENFLDRLLNPKGSKDTKPIVVFIGSPDKLKNEQRSQVASPERDGDDGFPNYPEDGLNDDEYDNLRDDHDFRAHDDNEADFLDHLLWDVKKGKPGSRAEKDLDLTKNALRSALRSPYCHNCQKVFEYLERCPPTLRPRKRKPRTTTRDPCASDSCETTRDPCASDSCEKGKGKTMPPRWRF